MTFVDAIKTCLSKYADFNGRASLSEYWWFVLFIVAGGFAISFVSDLLGMLFSLATLVPSIATAARRLHDTDKSGWLQLIALIPVLGWIAVIYLLVQPAKEPNRFGMAPELTPFNSTN
ncbi:uncharacterized membrane protein YhaH (DUF805 family) [Paucimonas lemoignei]|uniref:Uncharacterized membrane protein YhaH (DUF805 family) n=1 Tax=Paucimonas lemoignei TaxID=29443 RepID=A0A4V2UIT6_PAULE|nr:DUF805 domain-containing protein [Paucimonas lemoignei]TCS37410.1 uncharacterized membrane protein YhaH (DUF805 family) [Paucimonas lemoignei]